MKKLTDDHLIEDRAARKCLPEKNSGRKTTKGVPRKMLMRARLGAVRRAQAYQLNTKEIAADGGNYLIHAYGGGEINKPNDSQCQILDLTVL